jgi:hypothetical protein
MGIAGIVFCMVKSKGFLARVNTYFYPWVSVRDSCHNEGILARGDAYF